MLSEVAHQALVKVSGAVSISSVLSQKIAAVRSSRHISADGCSPEQQAGRSGWPKIAQRKSSARCAQRTPAGLFKDEMEGAMQHAPQPGRQFIYLIDGVGAPRSVHSAMQSTPAPTDKHQLALYISPPRLMNSMDLTSMPLPNASVSDTPSVAA